MTGELASDVHISDSHVCVCMLLFYKSDVVYH